MPTELRTLSGPFGALRYTDEGEGPVILAIHGVPGSHRDFSPLVRAAQGRLRFIRVDLPGFGESPPGPYETLDRRAELALAIAEALDLRDLTLMGHSLGGVSCVQAAGLDGGDRVRAVALLASVGLSPHRAYRRAPVRGLSALSRQPGALRWLRPALLPLMARAGFVVRGPDGLRLTLAALGELDFAAHEARVRALPVPALIAWCDDDPLIEPEVQEALAAALPPGPRLRYPTGGHVPQKTHAEPIVEALLAMLGG